MEQFDVLDINGKPTGLRYDKGTPLKDGQYYLGVHVYIYNSSFEFLLQKRSYQKKILPGIWDVLLEHVIAGETSKEGVIRGIREEIGLSVPVGNIRFAERFIRERLHHLIDVYFINFDFEVNQLVLQSEEVIDVKTVSKEEMLEMVSKMYYRPVEYREFLTLEINKLSA